MKKITKKIKDRVKNPTMTELVATAAVFGVAGLLTFAGYKLFKSLDFDLNFDDIDWDNSSDDSHGL